MSFTHPFGLLAILSMLCLFGGCPDNTSILFVDVVTDVVPTVEFVSIHVDFGAGRIIYLPTGTNLFVRGVRVAQFEGVEPGTYEGLVRLVGPTGRIVVARPFIAEIREGQQTATVVVARSCRSVSCPTAAAPSATACLGDVCVDPRCSVQHPEFCPTPSCTNDAECSVDVSCADPVCAGGVCLAGARSGACGSREYCDPVLDCVDLPNADAGMSDSGLAEVGPSDTGSDTPLDVGCACTPGTTLNQGACGRGCGRTRRHCGDDCQWEEDTCIEDSTQCWLWARGGGWVAYSESTAADAPPATAVVAAFDVEAMGEAYVLTATTYHVLTLADRSWVAAGSLASLLPGMSGTPVWALSIPASYTGPGATGSERAMVTTTAGQTYLFDHQTGTRQWRSAGSGSCCSGDGWASPNAPMSTAIHASWFDSENTQRLYNASADPLCPAAEGMGTVAYQAMLAPPNLHYLERRYCTEFAPLRLARADAPFGGLVVGGGSGHLPTPSRVTALFYHETNHTLWAFTR